MRLLALWRRFLFACVAGWLLAAAVPGTALAASCAPATTQGTAPADFRTYCWLDFSTYVDTTARTTAGQTFSFGLPDGTNVSMNLRVTTFSGTNANTALIPTAVPSWTGSAFGNVAFNGIPNKPILYTGTDGSTVTFTIRNITVTPPTGGSANYSIIVGDGESTNAGETLSFTTNGGNWSQVAQIANGGTTYPTVSGLNSKTVSETGVAGTVGSYVFRTDTNPTQVTATMKASGLQGVIVGLRYASISAVSQITNQRYNAADQFVYSLGTTTGTKLATGTTTGTATSGFAAATVPTVAASYPFVVSQAMAPGSVGTLANYTTTLTCTNSNSGSATTMPTNLAISSSSGSYTFNSLAYGDAVLCTFTNTPIFNTITGTVYSDANHNGAQDGAEAGPGVTGFYAKVAQVSGGACTNPALNAVAVDATTGAYTLPNLPQGTYCVILDNNSTLTDITPTLPTGWLGMQNASGLLQVNVAAGSPAPPPQVFGVYNGSKLTGTVFADTGVGSGNANNGTKDGTEPGLASVTVTLANGATTVATTSTAGDGSFTLWVPSTITAALTLTPTVLTNYQNSGGNVGTTGGSYARPKLTYTPVAGSSYTGVAFGMVPPESFAPNGAQTAQPGTVVFYAHTFQAGSGGQATFTVTNAPSPAGTVWSTVLYQDANCSGALESTEIVVTSAITMTAGQQVCLVLKQFVPSGIAYGALNTATITANFVYTGSSPALTSVLTVTDTTTGGEPSALSLKKMVSNVTRGGSGSTSVSASPGEVLQYTLTAQNLSAYPVSTLVINDATPAFTTFVSTVCPGAFPSGITGCTIATQPAAGNAGSLQWTFTGTLNPGLSLVVTYNVKLTE
ncbi:CshA/CshB family fibrillar adhesin-related protein [Ramlibacter agri]|nr:CshA/CshB family fibrillar adhesin-related protein [Ramlibacter agri]